MENLDFSKYLDNRIYTDKEIIEKNKKLEEEREQFEALFKEKVKRAEKEGFYCTDKITFDKRGDKIGLYG